MRNKSISDNMYNISLLIDLHNNEIISSVYNILEIGFILFELFMFESIQTGTGIENKIREMLIYKTR